SVISISKASSKAITSSTVSSESAPRSSTNDALDVTSPSSTPSCSTMICFTLSSTAGMVFLVPVRAASVEGGRPPRSKTHLLTYLGLLVNVVNRVLNGPHFLRIFVRNLQIKRFFQ